MTPLFDHPRLVPINQVVRSTINPRKRFSEDSLNELASNIKRHGVLQPILVRPTQPGIKPAMHEIVAGERRWRATRIAGLDEVPCIVREMTDIEALEIAVIENAQREDLHPLEEAEGFEALLKAYGHSEVSASSAEELATKIGKSRTHVYNRLKLLDLVPELREAFYTDEINASVAMMLARMPIQLQPKAMAKLKKAAPDGDAMSVRSAQQLLRKEFMLRLEGATFPIKDADLLPSAGSCIQCTKRTGAVPDLFQDVEHADTCTDPGCYADKVDAFNGQAKAKALSKGLQVFEGDNARALLKFGVASDELNGDYVYMDRPLQNLTGTDKTIKKLLGTFLKPSALFEHPKDKTLREIVQVTKAIDALRNHDLLTNDPEQHKPAAKKAQPDLGTSVATKPDDSHTKPTSFITPEAAWPLPVGQDGGKAADGDDTDQQSDTEVERKWRTEAFKALHKALHDKGYGFPSTAKRALAVQLGGERLTDMATWQLMCQLWGWPLVALSNVRDEMEELVADLTDDAVEILLSQLAVVKDIQEGRLSLHSEFPEELDITQLCDDDEVEVDWQTMRYQAMHPELSGSDLPHVSPPAATGDIGAPANGGDKSPQENKEQARQGAQSQEGSIQLAHWVGQKVKIRTTKRLGEVREVRVDGTLVVAVPSTTQEGVFDLKFCTTHDLQVLPGQVHPTGVTA